MLDTKIEKLKMLYIYLSLILGLVLNIPSSVCFNKLTVLKAGSTVRIMFFHYISAFNMIQPVLLCKKQQKIQVDASTTTWIIDYLTNRVRLKGLRRWSAAQGTVLSLFLFTLYTSDLQYNSES